MPLQDLAMRHAQNGRHLLFQLCIYLHLALNKGCERKREGFFFFPDIYAEFMLHTSPNLWNEMFIMLIIWG